MAQHLPAGVSRGIPEKAYVVLKPPHSVIRDVHVAHGAGGNHLDGCFPCHVSDFQKLLEMWTCQTKRHFSTLWQSVSEPCMLHMNLLS